MSLPEWVCADADNNHCRAQIPLFLNYVKYFSYLIADSNEFIIFVPSNKNKGNMLYIDFISKLKVFEGLRIKAYRCPSGVWTVGYGHTHGVTPNMIITGNEADCFLKYDLLLVRCQLAQLHPKLLTCSGLFYALTDFVFNVGIAKYKRSTLRKVVDNIKDYFCLTENDIASLSVQFLLWTKSNGKTLRGLEKRRQWEVSLLNQ